MAGARRTGQEDRTGAEGARPGERSRQSGSEDDAEFGVGLFDEPEDLPVRKQVQSGLARPAESKDSIPRTDSVTENAGRGPVAAQLTGAESATFPGFEGSRAVPPGEGSRRATRRSGRGRRRKERREQRTGGGRAKEAPQGEAVVADGPRSEEIVPASSVGEGRNESPVAECPEFDLPAWVEDEEPPRPTKHAGRARSDLLPAGAGIEPEPLDGAPPVATARPAHKRIVVDAMDPEEIRIAVVEDGCLEELYYERASEKKYLGNIYKGRVVNLEPAIQAAFVDVGIGRNGFLHVSDVLPSYKDSPAIPFDSLSVRPPERKKLRIQDILRKGQEVLVQISKDAIGAKGPSLTTYVSVPGKYLVLMPGVSRHGVSKKIQAAEERAKLRGYLEQLQLPKGVGYIVRTAVRDRPLSDLEKDFRYLTKVWNEIRARAEANRAPCVVYEETDIVIRALRDLLQPDVDELVVDSPQVYERARTFVEDVMPEFAPRLKHYSGATPVFTRYGVEEQIEKIYNRRVPLPSGGYIVVEQTEALVAIDVNSGKYRTEEDLEATALKTNLEAAREIARQLRLRDLGGVIVNDFIDMENEANRRLVERALRAALKRDRAKSWISRISRFGIIEMTRQRVRPSFERANHEPCRYCGGAGFVKSTRSVGIAILRQVRAALAGKRRSGCEIVAHPSVVEYLLNERRDYIAQLEREFQKTISVRVDPGFGPEQYAIR